MPSRTPSPDSSRLASAEPGLLYRPSDPRSWGGAQPPEPLRLPAPLSQLPWDLAQDQFGVQGADFIGVMGALLVRATQDQLRAYRVDSKIVADTLCLPGKQDPIPL